MQLREFVDTVTADEPPMARTADDIVAAGRRAERRRRAGFASAGAAGLVAAVVGGAFVLPTYGARPTVPAATTPVTGAATAPEVTFDFTFQGYDAGKLHVQDPITVSTAYQMASIYADGRWTNDKPVQNAGEKELADNRSRPRLNAFLTVYRPGAFDPAGIRGGQKVTVAGRDTVQANLPAELDPAKPAVPGNKLLAWQYADNAWAVVTSQSNSVTEPSFADLGRLIPGLKPVAPSPARLPFTVGYLPEGYRPAQVGSHASVGLGGINLAQDGTYGAAEFSREARPATGLTKPWEQGADAPAPGLLTIYVLPVRNSNTQAAAGETKCFKWGECSIWTKDGKTKIEVGGRLPEAELTRVAQSVKLADLTQESTWTPADVALRP